MPSLTQALAGNWVVANLGAGGDGDYPWPAEVLVATTVIEIDGATAPAAAQKQYYARHRLKQVVAGSATPRTFQQRAYWGSSSLLEARPEVVAKYALADLYRVTATEPVAPETLPHLLAGLNLPGLDFLKTDLEGLDGEILHSLGGALDGLLAIQCEVRPEPIYQGEPDFYALGGFLRDHGFTLAGLRPEIWRPASARQGQHLDGVWAWADALFLKSPEALPNGEPLTRAKHVLLAALLGKKSYGEWLLERYAADLPAEWQASLRALLAPERGFGHGWRELKTGLLRALYVTPLWPWLRRTLKRQSGLLDHRLMTGIDW